MIKLHGSASWLATLLLVIIGLSAGCTAGDLPPGEPSLLEQAAAEATAIVEQARATALIQQAHAQATALFETTAPASPTPLLPPPTTPTAVPLSTLEATPSVETQPAAASSPPATAAESGGRLEILSVSYGADGAYLVVNFLADPQVSQTFWPGVLSLTNESNGVVYNEVPVLPIIGPLIARPREYGQPGYFMLVNAPEYLAPGSQVTVNCGEFEFEHILVQ